jgi:predicted membrane protein
VTPAPAARWWRPARKGWWIGVLFAAGSVCFAVASFASQWASAPRPAIGVTFFAGSIAFTVASFLQLTATARGPWRGDRLAALVQLAGTLFFNVSTFAAMQRGFDARETDLRVWAPDAFGSVCFLVASELALAGVCHRWVCWDTRSHAWRIAALNLLGSVAFGVAAVTSLVEPSTSEPVSAAIANAGTTLGAVCFLAGAVMLLPGAAAPRPATWAARRRAPRWRRARS